MSSAPATSDALHAHERAAVTLARWLDSYLLDPLIGFFLPGAGDLLSALAGLYIVEVGRRKGLPAVVLARMLLNLALDAMLGSIPIAGDLADFFVRPNAKNAALLQARHPAKPARAGDYALVLGAALLFLAALAVPIGLVVWGVSRLLDYAP